MPCLVRYGRKFLVPPLLWGCEVEVGGSSGEKTTWDGAEKNLVKNGDG